MPDYADQTTTMLDNSNLSGMPAAPAAAPEKPSMWKRLLFGALTGLVGGAGQKNFASGVGAGGRFTQELGQQQVQNQQHQQQLDQDKVFRDAEAANYTAAAAARQTTLDQASESLRASIESKEGAQAEKLLGMGLKPIAVMSNDSKSAMAALQQAQQVTPDGKVPPVVTFHYGNKIVAFNLDDMQQNPGILQQVNKANLILGRPQIDQQTWVNTKLLPSAAKNKLITDAMQLLNPVAAGGQKTYGQIEYYKNLVAKAEAMPESDDKAATVKSLKEAQASLEAAAKEGEASQIRVAAARGAAYGASRPMGVIDSDGNLVIQPAGQAEREGSAPAAQGANAMAAQAQVKEIETGSQAFRKSISNLDAAFSTDQVAKLVIAAHSNDDKVVSGALQSLASQNLTPAQKDYVVNYTQMIERIMSVRKMAGMGQGSDATRAAMQRTIPGPGSGDKDMALRKLDAVDQQINVLKKGIPKLKGQQSAAPANATPAADLGAAPTGKPEGSTGTLPDGTKVVIRNGRVVKQ